MNTKDINRIGVSCGSQTKSFRKAFIEKKNKIKQYKKFFVKHNKHIHFDELSEGRKSGSQRIMSKGPNSYHNT